MSDKIVNVRVKHTIDTFANWTDHDPVLLAGEIAFVTDAPGKTGIASKIGDGKTTFTMLPWHGDGAGGETVLEVGTDIRLQEEGEDIVYLQRKSVNDAEWENLLMFKIDTESQTV